MAVIRVTGHWTTRARKDVFNDELSFEVVIFDLASIFLHLYTANICPSITTAIQLKAVTLIKVTTENSYTFQLTAYSYNSQDLGVELNYIQVTNKKSLKLRLSLIEVASKFKMVNLQLSVVISLVYT